MSSQRDCFLDRKDGPVWATANAFRKAARFLAELALEQPSTSQESSTINRRRNSDQQRSRGHSQLLRIINSTSRTENTENGRRSVRFTCLSFSGRLSSVESVRGSPSRGSSERHSNSGAMDRSSISISGESLISDLSISAEERAFSYRLAAGDQRGHIYIFNFSDNRFNLLCRTGISATCMAFNRRHGSELLVALSDTSVHCYNIDTGQLVAKLSSHNTEPHCLSVHPNPKVALAISTSRTEAILWDTDGWIRERIMRGENHDGMQQVCFNTDGTKIIASFMDGVVLVWDADTFQQIWQFEVEPPPPVSPTSVFAEENHISSDQPSNDFNNETSFVNLGSEQLRLFRQTELFSAEREGYFALSADGDLLVHYALGFTLQVFNVRERTRLHEILIPELAIEHPDEDRSGVSESSPTRSVVHSTKTSGLRYIVRAEFIGQSHIAAVLSNHGNFVLVDTIVGKLVGSVRNTGIETCAVSPDGLVLCLVRKHARHIADLIALDPVRLATDSSDSETTENGLVTALDGGDVKGKGKQKEQMAQTEQMVPEHTPAKHQPQVSGSSSTPQPESEQRPTQPVGAIPFTLTVTDASESHVDGKGQSKRVRFGKGSDMPDSLQEQPASIARDPVPIVTSASPSARQKGNAQRDDSDIVERLVPKSNPVIAKSEPQKSFFEMVESKRESSMLNRIKLAKFVVHCGTYPNKFRILIWRFLLKLPENREAYEALIGQGIHPAYMSFRQKYPLKSDRTARTVERILSALAFWSPIFEHLEYLPGMIFPFVQVFQGDTYSCFECVMAFLMNWCQKWWDYYPNPPVEVLDIIEDLLAFHDRELFEHFQRLGITSQTYAWVLLSSLFTDACTKAEWQQLMDHVITQGPAFLYYLVVSYQVQFRIQLLHSHRADDIKKFYQRKNAMKLDRFLHRTYLIREKTPDVMSPSSYLRPFKPVLRGAYPIFDQYPSFIVNYQAKLRERIRKDEEDYIRKRRATEEVVKLAEELKRDKRAWEEADKAMSDVVDTWWESMLDEEAAHVEKQSVREALEIEERTKALRRMAKARKSFLQNRAAMSSKAMDVAARTTGEGRRTADVIEETLDLDTQFKDLEREWLERRKELLRARENIAGVDHARFQTLISSRSPSPSRSPNPDQGFRASGSASRVGSQDQRTRSQREIPLQM